MCFGHTSFVQRDDRGERLRLLEADESVYVYPERARMPLDSVLRVGEHDLPDVILEVDNTTDVRRGKLALYESWGFPEVWVEVPEVQTPGRPRGLVRGLTVYRLEGGRFRAAPESGAFPGWRASEIHAALNELHESALTSSALTRVGRALAARDGTRPDDTPWLRIQREEGRAEGRAKGRAEGREQGIETAMDAILAGRGFAWAEVRARSPQTVPRGGCGRDRGPPSVRGRGGLPGPAWPPSILSPARAEGSGGTLTVDGMLAAPGRKCRGRA